MFKWLKKKSASGLNPVGNGHKGHILESFTGAWQQNIEINKDDYPSYYAVFACATLIASDISKMPLLLKKLAESGVWIETSKKEYSSL